MIALRVDLDIDSAPWRDIDGAAQGMLARVCGIPKGTGEGLPAVGIAVQLDDGTWVIAQTTMRLFVTAARAFAARYPEVDS